MEELQYKYECSVCDKRIYTFDPVKGKTVRNLFYREADVLLSDGSVMRTGVCKDHEKPAKEDLLTMTIKTHLGWEEEIAGGFGDEEWVRSKGLKLSVVGVAG